MATIQLGVLQSVDSIPEDLERCLGIVLDGIPLAEWHLLSNRLFCISYVAIEKNRDVDVTRLLNDQNFLQGAEMFLAIAKANEYFADLFLGTYQLACLLKEYYALQAMLRDGDYKPEAERSEGILDQVRILVGNWETGSAQEPGIAYLDRRWLQSTHRSKIGCNTQLTLCALLNSLELLHERLKCPASDSHTSLQYVTLRLK
jgi:hypothetical protein